MDMVQFKRPGRQSILIFILILITVSAVCVTVWALFFRTPEVVLAPDHAPAVETNAQPIPGDTGVHGNAQPGSGNVSLTYSNEVKIRLSDKKAQLLFANPGRSNQDMVLQVIVQGQVIAQSKLIPPGNELNVLTLRDDIELSPGGYDGKYTVLYYYENGEKAMVQTDIPLIVKVQE